MRAIGHTHELTFTTIIFSLLKFIHTQKLKLASPSVSALGMYDQS